MELPAEILINGTGIVDRDRRSAQEVEYLRRKRVMVPDVAEIENLLMLEEVVRTVASAHRRDETKAFSKVKAALSPHPVNEPTLLCESIDFWLYTRRIDASVGFYFSNDRRGPYGAVQTHAKEEYVSAPCHG